MAKILDLLDSVNQKFDGSGAGMSSANAQDAILEAYNSPANMPPSGTVGQYIRKQGPADYDVLWEDLKIADDTAPVLGGDLQTDGNVISIQDLASVEQGQIGYSSTGDSVYLAYIADPVRGYDPLTDGGVGAKAGELTLSGSVIELNAFKGGSENFQLYVSPDGVLFGVKAPATGWQEVDTDNADYTFPALGTWVQITGLFITVPQVVDAGDRIDAFVNLYFQNGSDSQGGSVDIGIGINGVAPTTALNNVRIEAGFDSVVATAITTTTHGGIAANDTITVFVRRSTQDNPQFDPQVFGSIDPSELIVSVPGEGGGGPGGDPTNLGNVPGPSTVTITSSTGSNTVIAAAISGTAGVMTGAQVDTLASRIAATDVTYENLDANGDVGPGVGQLEPGLDNPTTDGFVLSSTVAGDRSWVAPGGTDLGTTPAADNVTITSSSGLDTIIPGATSGPTGAGVMTSAQVVALNGKGDLAGDNSWLAENVFLGNFEVGDPGAETGAVLIDGISYPTIGKFNRFGTGNTAEVVIHRHSTVDGSNLVFSRALSNDSSHANVINGTVLGDIQFTGWGNSSYWSGAIIQAVVDGTPGVSDMPTKIDFLTAPDGSFTPALRMSIRADGTVEVAGDMSVGGVTITAAKINTWDAAEPGLGNPTTDGYILSSTAAGVRSWVAPGAGGGIPEPANDTYGYVRLGATTNDWARGARVFEQATAPTSPSIGDIWIDTA